MRPNLLSDEALGLARALGALPAADVEPLPDAVLAPSCLDRRLVAKTLAAFHRVNTRNALVLAALRDGHNTLSPPPCRAAPTPTARRVLPMADLAGLALNVKELLRGMSAPITGGH